MIYLVPVSIERSLELMNASFYGCRQQRRTRLAQSRRAIDAQVGAFEASVTELRNLAVGAKLDSTLVRDLLECYKNARFRLREEIEKAQANPLRAKRCVLCLVDSAQELDHFLPKASFPELSVYARNLVPVCSGCNKARNGAGWRNTINPYFDDFEQHDVCLTARVAFEPDGPRVIFSVAGESKFSIAVSTHVTTLGLLTRWAMEAEIALSEWLPEFTTPLGCRTREALTEFLEAKALSCQLWGPYHWRTVLAQSLLNQLADCEAYFEVQS